jgi:uncharacterized membrane protein (UPF0127 family)
MDPLKKSLVGALIAVILLSLFAGYLLLKPATRSAKIEIAGVILTVEFAETTADQQRGLSGRPSLPADHGMLFIFDHEAPWGFWMNGMKFPLDMIWFNSTREAVFMEQDLQPCGSGQCPIYTPPVAALYVLEVNAGFVHVHGVTLRTTFAFVG